MHCNSTVASSVFCLDGLLRFFEPVVSFTVLALNGTLTPILCLGVAMVAALEHNPS